MKTNRHTDKRLLSSQRGFTLMELLVAMAIFTTVLTGVTLLFNSAIRTSKQGFQNQEAFEIARGAMDLIERDINRAFTARDQGDVANFYGTPIGFSFIGLISDADEADNVGRITYVIYHDPNNPRGESGSLNTMSTVETDPIYTYHLLRYVEPGAEDLESYPIDWAEDLPDQPGTYNKFLTEAVKLAVQNGTCLDADVPCKDEVRKAKRREIWIRMLSGGDPNLEPGDSNLEPQVPNAWKNLPEFSDLDPADYVVAENIRYLESNGGVIVPALGFPDIEEGYLASYNENNAVQPYFTYSDYGVRDRRDSDNLLLQASDAVGNPLWVDADEKIPLRETETIPIRLRFWHDTRNIAYATQKTNVLLTNGLDDDRDLITDEADEAYGLNLGSPFDGRLPIEFSINFTLFFPSPFPGAPDFNETFTQRIDLPTGYRRAITAPAPAL